MNRRELFRTAGAVMLTPMAAALETRTAAQSTAERGVWIDRLRRIAAPVLQNLANGTLKQRMPIQAAAGADRRAVSHLEAIGRLIAGLAPWIELEADATVESGERAALAELARRAIGRAVDPASPDFLNFTRDRQPLVDAAFLAHGLLRAKRTLVDALAPATKANLVAALESTRAITPSYSNWLLFSSMVEAGLSMLGARPDLTRVDYAVRQHDAWYKGDGAYGDGPSFHWDYYNSFVIHPMLLDVLDHFQDRVPAYKAMAARELERAQRYASIQERTIGPDGSFPPIGRSLAYRCGAFQALAQIALRRALPDEIPPGQARGALTAVIQRTLDAPGTFDDNGWLTIGLCGNQPGVGESYISTGSLYLCTVAFLPLGLPASDPFWASPPQPWTSKRAWSGQPFPIDHALAT